MEHPNTPTVGGVELTMPEQTKADHFDVLLLSASGIGAMCLAAWNAVAFWATGPEWIKLPGRTAMWLFVGISGYVMAYGYVCQRYRMEIANLRDDYLTRLLRIYPIFLALSLVCWVATYLQSGSNPMPLDQVPIQLLALQFDHAYLLNGVFWPLVVEMHFYHEIPSAFWPGAVILIMDVAILSLWLAPGACEGASDRTARWAGLLGALSGASFATGAQVPADAGLTGWL